MKSELGKAAWLQAFSQGNGGVWVGVTIGRLNLVSGAGQRKLGWWIKFVRQRESRRLVYWESDWSSWQSVWDSKSRSLQESRLPLHNQ